MLKGITKWRLKAETDDPKVRLISPSVREPATAVERKVIATLNCGDSICLSVLVARVARDLYRDEVAAGATILDIGLFGPDLFAHDVAMELCAGNGILWSIDSPRRLPVFKTR